MAQFNREFEKQTKKSIGLHNFRLLASGLAMTLLNLQNFHALRSWLKFLQTSAFSDRPGATWKTPLQNRSPMGNSRRTVAANQTVQRARRICQQTAPRCHEAARSSGKTLGLSCQKLTSSSLSMIIPGQFAQIYGHVSQTANILFSLWRFHLVSLKICHHLKLILRVVQFPPFDIFRGKFHTPRGGPNF